MWLGKTPRPARVISFRRTFVVSDVQIDFFLCLLFREPLCPQCGGSIQFALSGVLAFSLDLLLSGLCVLPLQIRA